MDAILISAVIHRTNTNNFKPLVNEREINLFHTTGLMKWIKVQSEQHKKITLLTLFKNNKKKPPERRLRCDCDC